MEDLLTVLDWEIVGVEDSDLEPAFEVEGVGVNCIVAEVQEVKECETENFGENVGLIDTVAQAVDVFVAFELVDVGDDVAVMLNVFPTVRVANVVNVTVARERVLKVKELLGDRVGVLVKDWRAVGVQALEKLIDEDELGQRDVVVVGLLLPV